MADIVSAAQRSKLMSSVRTSHTKPELVVRKLLHSLGYRFRLHSKVLPGRPDIVLPKYKKVVFVHGCFWHSHDCPKGSLPTTNVDFWRSKLAGNKSRDQLQVAELKERGWEAVVVWECETKDLASLTAYLSMKISQ